MSNAEAGASLIFSSSFVDWGFAMAISRAKRAPYVGNRSIVGGGCSAAATALASLPLSLLGEYSVTSDRTFVHVEREAEVGIITVDNPSVNALAHGVRAALFPAIEALDEDDSVRAIVLNGAGRHFSAGADIRELEHQAIAPILSDVLFRLESCRKLNYSPDSAYSRSESFGRNHARPPEACMKQPHRHQLWECPQPIALGTPSTDRSSEVAVPADHRSVARDRVRYIGAPSCGPAPADGQSPISINLVGADLES